MHRLAAVVPPCTLRDDKQSPAQYSGKIPQVRWHRRASVYNGKAAMQQLRISSGTAAAARYCNNAISSLSRHPDRREKRHATYDHGSDAAESAMFAVREAADKIGLQIRVSRSQNVSAEAPETAGEYHLNVAKSFLITSSVAHGARRLRSGLCRSGHQGSSVIIRCTDTAHCASERGERASF